MTVFQLNPEHCIAQCLENYAILFNQWLFRHTIFGSAKIVKYNGKMKPLLIFLISGSENC